MSLAKEGNASSALNPDMIDLTGVEDQLVESASDTLEVGNDEKEDEVDLSGTTFDPNSLEVAPDEAAEDESQEASGEEAGEEAEEADKPAAKPTGAQARIRDLVAKSKTLSAELAESRKQAEAAVAQAQAQMQQQFQGWAQSMQSQMAQLAQQNELLNQQLRGIANPEKPEAELSYEEQFRRSILKKNEEFLQKELENRLKPYQEKLGKWESSVQAQQQAALVKQFETATDEVVNGVLASDLLEQDREALKPFLKDFTMTAAASWRKQPQEVAAEVKRGLNAYARALLNATKAKQTAKSSSEKGAPKVAAPKVLKSGTSGVKGAGSPQYSRDQILKAGYENRLEAFLDGWKRLK